jgi:hypothetical protein
MLFQNKIKTASRKIGGFFVLFLFFSLELKLIFNQ